MTGWTRAATATLPKYAPNVPPLARSPRREPNGNGGRNEPGTSPPTARPPAGTTQTSRSVAARRPHPGKRAEWHRAYSAAGMPEDRRPEAELSDGRLLVRASAAERIEQAASS